LITETLDAIGEIRLSPLDYLPQGDLREKMVGLVLRGVPEEAHGQAKSLLTDLRNRLIEKNVDEVNVVVFGGGTGLSNLIGGDSRRKSWAQNPFCGLKEIFPRTRSIVCVTDDGGSTGELLKDLPLVAIGDIRHVLLSSIQFKNLQLSYGTTRRQANQIVEILYSLFNYRSSGPLRTDSPDLEKIKTRLDLLPHELGQYIKNLVKYLFADIRLSATLHRPHCFGNLLVAAAVYREIRSDVSNDQLAEQKDLMHYALLEGLNNLSQVLGAGKQAVLPCTSTPALLRVHYTNGVEIIGENKLTESKRGFPVESIQVDYFGDVHVLNEVFEEIQQADILILAPGSLYSSIIPVFKVPGLAQAVRNNTKALKILISNLWVQAGETDLSIADPERKFHVSDMIRAYEKNIPGGTKDLFNEVICVSLVDIPASFLQRYAVEGKVPIFLDRDKLDELHYMPIECGVYSKKATDRGVIQHDPDTLALAVKALYNGRHCFKLTEIQSEKNNPESNLSCSKSMFRKTLPFQRHRTIVNWLDNLAFLCKGQSECINKQHLIDILGGILWDHPTIPLSHLEYVSGISCIEKKEWNRDQRWDNVFSFYDPDDRYIKIRNDQFLVREKTEVALMIALGESLLGNYASKKVMKDVVIDGLPLGRIFHLYLRVEEKRSCFLTTDQLATFLSLARMCPTEDKNHYTRLVNKSESFTPPGLLMGLMYAWYLDNRLATHIEYKMSLMKINKSNLIPEQLRMAKRREKMITFFRDDIFDQSRR